MKTKNKTPNKKNNAIETILVVIAIIVIPLFFSMNTGANSQAEQNTNESLLPTVVANIPPVNEEAKPKQPPACTFPLAQTTIEESVPEEYVFSEPEVVLSDIRPISIIEWLPDSKKILLTRENNDRYQLVELFDTETYESLVYGRRRPTVYYAYPAWVENLSAIIYPSTEIIKFNDVNGTRQPPYEIKRQLWISQGDTEQAQTIEDEILILDHLSAFSVSVNFAGDRIAYINNTDKQIFRYSISEGLLERLPPLAFDPNQWDYRQEALSTPITFRLTWQPNTSNIYTFSDSNNGRYSFLLSTESGEICELDLFPSDTANSWVMTAQWSQNGRYLAIVRTKGQLPISFSNLIVLDTHSGSLYEVNPTNLESTHNESISFISDVAWAPDNNHIAVIGRFGENSNLYLINFLSNQIIPIHSPQGISNNIGEKLLIWSKDGSRLLVKCPTNQEDRLCIYSLQNSIQQ